MPFLPTPGVSRFTVLPFWYVWAVRYGPYRAITFPLPIYLVPLPPATPHCRVTRYRARHCVHRAHFFDDLTDDDGFITTFDATAGLPALLVSTVPPVYLRFSIAGFTILPTLVRVSSSHSWFCTVLRLLFWFYLAVNSY
jgi:hypothetical protein